MGRAFQLGESRRALAQPGPESNRERRCSGGSLLSGDTLAVSSRELPVHFLDFGGLEGQHDLAAAARSAKAGEIDRLAKAVIEWADDGLRLVGTLVGWSTDADADEPTYSPTPLNECEGK